MRPLLCYFSQIIFKRLIVISDIHYVCLSGLLMDIDNPRLTQNFPPAIPAGSHIFQILVYLFTHYLPTLPIAR